MMRQQILGLSGALLLAMAGVACDEASLPEGACTQLPGDFASSFVIDAEESFALDVPAMTETDSGLCYEVLVEGGGEAPASGDYVQIVGETWISNGTPAPDTPVYSFAIDAHGTIEGINEAVAAMAVGDVRRLIIPPELAHGDDGALGIPPGAILVAEVELLETYHCANETHEFDISLGIDTDDFTQTGTGLCVRDDLIGSGDAAVPGDSVSVAYTGWLIDGFEFDSGPSLPVALGSGQVIAGFDEGLRGMQVGGHRTIIIPSELAYGPAGSSPNIPPNSTLVFDLELLTID